MDVDKETLVMGLAGFLVFAIIGFYVAFSSTDNPGKTGYREVMNVTVNQNNDIRTISFDNNSLNLMHEDSKSAKFYFDLDRDGGFDRVINVTRDGVLRNSTEVVTYGNTSYRIYFKYRDSKDLEGDSWLTVYMVEEIV